ncbi:hypothetical protein [Pseudoxanthomonas sp.]|uniref:hypothetical protein n=1 Tax=Pseudoxanthomonas sp. TaxID=1871049 RepID=UPI0025E58076|nr:hypothetical protein [Pseudoxanthomonas sp.]
MISYEQFLALAEGEDIRVLNLLSQGQVIQFDNAADADVMQARIDRLDTAEFLLRATRHRDLRDGVRWHVFEAIVDPVASTYVAKAAAERVALSREPLPVA